jgi:uncharacterized membrane protein (DUF106 family)
MEWLLSPWVIIIVVVAVVVGNIAALKYTANTKMTHMSKHRKSQSELDKLNELDKHRHGKKDEK